MVGFLPVSEIRVDHSVGESFTANTNTFKYTVTSELMHNQVRIDDTCKNKFAILSLHRMTKADYLEGSGGG